MATTYTAFTWPPLIFPLPVALLTTKAGGTFEIGARPPMNLPLPLAARTSLNGGTAAPPTAPSQVITDPTPSSVSFTPAATAVSLDGQANRVDPHTTQDQINTFFRISSPRPGSGS